MKTYRFRGKRVDNRKFTYGDLIQLNDGRKYIVDNRFGACIDNKGNFINTESPFVNQVITETVGQFTGAPDKYGTEIYEGNIVRIHDDDNDEVGVVVWDDSEHRWNIEQGNIVFELGSFYPRELEVIGNIHDNTELLK